MARKTGGDSSDGFHDIIGVVLLALALLLIVAQFSFEVVVLRSVARQTNLRLDE